jgi:hypothetical protein
MHFSVSFDIHYTPSLAMLPLKPILVHVKKSGDVDAAFHHDASRG